MHPQVPFLSSGDRLWNSIKELYSEGRGMKGTCHLIRNTSKQTQQCPHTELLGEFEGYAKQLQTAMLTLLEILLCQCQDRLKTYTTTKSQ